MKFPKIQTLWKRNDSGLIIPGEYSEPEFENMKKWAVSEKLDGMNCRIFIGYNAMDKNSNYKEFDIEGYKIFLKGKTDNAELNEDIMDNLEKEFKKNINIDKLKELYEQDTKVILYGELVGDKAQKNSWKYVRKENEKQKNEVILFDVFINGWWFDPDKLKEFSDSLGFRCVEYEIMDEQQIIKFVKKKPKSKMAVTDRRIEGIVAKSYPLVLFRRGNPVVFKLKVSDYEKLERGEES